LNKPENIREFAAGKLEICLFDLSKKILMSFFIFTEYFTDPNLKENLNNMNNERERKYEVNKIIQELKTQNLNK